MTEARIISRSFWAVVVVGFLVLARELERKVVTSKRARSDAAAAVTDFSRALTELRDAAQALIGGSGGTD